MSRLSAPADHSRWNLFWWCSVSSSASSQCGATCLLTRLVNETRT